MSLLSIKNFNFSYPASAPSLTDINLEVASGSFNVLFGKSGSGKTTLLRQLKPSLTPHGTTSGAIEFLDSPIQELEKKAEASQIGYVLQNPDNQLVTDKVWHELAFGLESLGCDQATIRLQVAEMASYFGIQNWFEKKVTELSGGQKQLLNLASIMAMHPELLILDEPTSQLDPIAAANFLATLAKLNREIGTTILLSEHRLQEALPLADQVFLLDAGKLVAAGTPKVVGAQLKAQKSELFSAMPAAMQIYGAISSGSEFPLTVREGRNWLAGLDITPQKKLAASAPAALPKKAPAMIEAKDVWFRYERNSPDVIKDLNLTVATGEIFGLVGGNGTGKSTTLALMSRLLQPYRGQIKLAGQKINRLTDQALYHQFLGLLPQDPQSLFVKQTVLAELYEVIDGKKEKPSAAYPLKMKKETAVAGIAELTHLTELLDRHPYDLSGGEQQRLGLAKVLLLRPKILLLDEPTKGLDEFFKAELATILMELKQQGVTILLVSHDVEFVAEVADTCGLFFNGSVVTQKPAKEFFAGNNFYTTAANRIARRYFPQAVTTKDVIKCLKTIF